MRLIVLAALLATGAAADAGTRATYRMEDGRQLTIEVADNGEARVQEATSADYGVLKADGFYMVGGERGRQVARIEDIAAAMDRVVPPIFKGILSAAGQAVKPAENLRIVAGGERQVGSFKGRAYTVYGLNDEQKDAGEQFVISSDPKLVPVGRAMEQFMNAALIPVAVLMGPGVGDLIRETRSIFALGTPLDAGGRFRLEEVETIEVPSERIALPGKPQTVDEIEAELRASAAAAPSSPSRPH